MNAGSVRGAVRFPFKSTIDTSQMRVQLRTNDERGGVDVLALDVRAAQDGEPAVILLCEVPDTNYPVRDKPAIEIHDAGLFMTRLGGHMAHAVVSEGPGGNQPPDCWVTIGDRAYGVELAQMSWPTLAGNTNELARWNRFELVRDHLFRESGRLGRRLRQHRGRVVMVWFGSDSNRLTPRRDAGETVADFLGSVSPPAGAESSPRLGVCGKAVVDFSKQLMPDDPGVFTDMAVSADRSVGCTWIDLPPDAKKSALHRAIGFDVALLYSETYTRAMVRTELRRIVQQHDNAVNDVLVVTVNAATRQGVWFPSMRLLADMIFDDPTPLVGWTPNDVRSVAVHDASTGRIRWVHGRSPWR